LDENFNQFVFLIFSSASIPSLAISIASILAETQSKKFLDLEKNQ
jgi:hypothetical protein